jgi:hypothetical protein
MRFPAFLQIISDYRRTIKGTKVDPAEWNRLSQRSAIHNLF